MGTFRATLCMAAVTLTSLALLPQSAEAAVGPNGQIVFSALDAGGSERIWTVQPDGSALTELTATLSGEQSAPVWSPDGTRIVFNDVATQSSPANLLVMDADGGNVSNITASLNPDGFGFDNRHPTWSPDGTELVWARNNDGDPDIFRGNADGTASRELVVNEPFIDNEFGRFYGMEQEPSWSPDGTRIVFTESLTQNSLALVEASGTSPLTYVEAPNDGFSYTNPAWSPEGTEVAYLRRPAGSPGDDLVVTNPDTGQTATVTPEGYTDFRDPGFSPDGTLLMFTAYSFLTGENAVWTLPRPVLTPGAQNAVARTATNITAVAATPTKIAGTTGALGADWAVATSDGCTISGTPRADRLVGTDGPDVICGLGGNDTVFGRAGDDVIIGGDGRDTLTGGAGADVLRGGAQSDRLLGVDGVRGNDKLLGEQGHDVCSADRGDVKTSC